MNACSVSAYLEQSRDVLQAAIDDPRFTAAVTGIAERIAGSLRNGGKVLLAGNGGSAGDAQHIAAEIVGRYKKDRPAYAAIALTTDSSALTAIGNDYGFEQVFSRQVEGLGQRGDVLLAITTSGHSPNILAALKAARSQGLVTVGFTGAKGAALAASCDHLLVVPSEDTAVIQQIYMAFAHGICGVIEQALAQGA